MNPADHLPLRIEKLEDFSAIIQLAKIGSQDALQSIASRCGRRIGAQDKILARLDHGPRGKGEVDTAGEIPAAEIDGCPSAIVELDKLQAVLTAVVKDVVVQLIDDDVEFIGAQTCAAQEQSRYKK